MFQVSFTGSGCLAAYQLGIARSLLMHMHDNSHLLFNQFSGSSGGAIVAAVFSQAVKMSKSESLQLLDAAIEYSIQCKLHKCGILLKDEFLEEDLIICCTTTSERQTKLYQKFHSVDDLTKCLRASCTIPPGFHPFDAFLPSNYENMGMEYKGSELMDGALSQFAPCLNKKTLIISPFSLISSTYPSELLVMPERMKPVKSIFTPKISLPGDGNLKLPLNLTNINRMQIAFGAPRHVLKSVVDAGVQDATNFLKLFKTYK
eukprot:g3592.t1